QRLRMPGALARDRLDVRERSVLVGLALDQQRGYADLGQRGLDVPASEVRMQPPRVPAPEGIVGILVVPGEARPQSVGRAVLVAGPLDAAQPHLPREEGGRQ